MARVTLVVNGFDSASETFLVSLVDGLRVRGHRVTVHGLLEGRTTARPGPGRSAGLPPLASVRGVLAVTAFVLRHPGVSGRLALRAVRRWGPGSRSLRAVLQAENYEEAALLRDEIRGLELGLSVSESGAD